MFSIALFVVGVVLLDGVHGATTNYTVRIGSQATITGFEYDAPAGRAFYGIPYAQPLTSRNRFMAPQRKDPSGDTTAFNMGASCLGGGQDGAGFAEDCLFLDIYTPKTASSFPNGFPVYIFIHGGGFQGKAYQLGHETILPNLCSRDVITVIINYRLSILGFFSSRDSYLPGNWGLMDQIEALNWVKRYISYFGGDPNTITIGGESAGGMSSSLLTLSPLSQNLFQRVIGDSGSGFTAGYVYNNNEQQQQDDGSRSAAIRLGCITAEDWDKHDSVHMLLMVQCLRSKTAHQLNTIGGFFVPVIDGPGGVLPERLDILAQRRPPMPTLIGNNHDEYFYILAGDILNNPTYTNQFTRQFMINDLVHNGLISYYNNSDMVRQAIKTAFIDSSPLADDDHFGWVKMWIQIYTNVVFIGPTYRDANLHRQTNSPVYIYSFDYLAPQAFPTLPPQLRDSAIPHGWQMQYIYRYPGSGWSATADDIATLNYCDTFWTNFIKYGNPTPAGSDIIWPQLGNNMEFMSIGPHPTPSVGFHPTAKFYACNIPAIEGVSPPAWCQ